MRSTGSRTLSTTPITIRVPGRRRVLFLCIGNICRSPMAEYFARRYGNDVMDPISAGLMPGPSRDLLVHRLMDEKGISLSDHFPKEIGEVVRPGLPPLDLVVNISGAVPPPFPKHIEVREWAIRDPYQLAETVYREVRDEIEQKVMSLVLEFRRSNA